MKKALVVGINHYAHSKNLYGCVNDAEQVARVLERHGTRYQHRNFGVALRLSKNKSSVISRKELREKVQEVFKYKSDMALFYFSGHGYVDNLGGYLITSDCEEGDDGFSMHELLNIANRSKALRKIIILDCCHSGYFGNTDTQDDIAHLSSGLTILCASDKKQYAKEQFGTGVFTSLLVNALEGNACNIMGNITLANIYAHIDQSLGEHEQRPIFKSNITRSTVVRKVKPLLELDELKCITKFFKTRESKFQLDPTFEHRNIDPKPIKRNVEKFQILQRMRAVQLVKPSGKIPHMWDAAMKYKSCELTELGKHYWFLVKAKRV